MCFYYEKHTLHKCSKFKSVPVINIKEVVKSYKCSSNGCLQIAVRRIVKSRFASTNGKKMKGRISSTIINPPPPPTLSPSAPKFTPKAEFSATSYIVNKCKTVSLSICFINDESGC